jgi:hypothetical protein
VPTLAELRRNFSITRLHRYKAITSGAKIAGVYVGVADGTDAQRQIVSTDLARASVSLGDAVAQSYYNGWYAYILTTIPEQQRVAIDGYEPNSTIADATDQAGTDPIGYLTTERSLAAVLAANKTVELHPHPILTDDVPGIHALLNQALSSMYTVRTLTLTATGTSRWIDVSAYPWLNQQWQLAAMRGPASSDELSTDFTVSGAQLKLNGEKRYVALPYISASGTYYVDTYAPRSAWIKVSGTWASSTTGLVNETDEAAGRLEDITLVAYYHYCMYRVGQDPRGENAYWANQLKLTAQAAAPMLVFNLDQPIDVPSAGGLMDSAAYLAARRSGARTSGGWGGMGGWP